MKSVLIIGLGRFGHHLCIDMANRGNEVMVIDKDEKKTPDLLEYATAVRVGDCTNEEVLRSLGVGNFDLCFVCIGSNFQSSLEITSLVKELGAKHVVSKANRDIHAKFLLRNGADEVFYPDRDIAERLAVKYSANHVFDYFELSKDYSIFEIQPKAAWIGRTIEEADIRANYHINVFGIKKNTEVVVLPRADYVMHEKDHLLVVGLTKDIDRLLASIKWGKENDKKESKIYGAVDCDHGGCNIFVFFSPELWNSKRKYSDDLYCGCTGHNSYNYRLSVWNDGFCMQCAAV